MKNYASWENYWIPTQKPPVLQFQPAPKWLEFILALGQLIVG